MSPKRAKYVVPLLVSTAALLFYVGTAAPGLTWANQGADGGDLLTAAVTNGVPHPPGYPFYTLLLQLWLALTGLILPNGDLAWRGNLFSAFCAALSVGVTALALSEILRQLGKSTWVAGIAAIGWTISPLLWSQATITEVYGLHALLFSLLGLWAVSEQKKYWQLFVLTMLGAAHHLTLLLLLPAALYAKWCEQSDKRISRALFLIGLTIAAVGMGLLFHLRTLWAATSVAPVNWGFATDWNQLWWLISGQAYRSYLLGASASVTFDRVAAWAYTITTQYTPVGLAIALLGLAYIDQAKPNLRNFSLIWLIPVSIYSILYYTRDSEIYLMPVGWLLTFWFTVGLTLSAEWVANKLQSPITQIYMIMGSIICVAFVALAGWRWSTLSLHNDSAAQEFLVQSASALTPGSIVICRGDEHTFALWYGAWAGKELPADLIIVNDSLLQFDWYRRLLAMQYPTIVGVDQSIELLVQQNKDDRSVFLADEIGLFPADELLPAGPLWKLK